MFEAKDENPEWDDLGEEKRYKFIERIRYVVENRYLRVPFGWDEEEFVEQKAKQVYETEVLGRTHKDSDWWMR